MDLKKFNTLADHSVKVVDSSLKMIDTILEEGENPVNVFFMLMSQIIGNFYFGLVGNVEKSPLQDVILEKVFIESLDMFISNIKTKVTAIGDVYIRKDKEAMTKKASVYERLKKVDPKHADEFDELAAKFKKEMENQ
jgi:translation initiation factor 6 (eIF-6)